MCASEPVCVVHDTHLLHPRTHKHSHTRARVHNTHQVRAEEAQQQSVPANDVVALERSELLRLSLTDAWPLLDSMPNLWYALRDLAHRHRHRGGREGGKIRAGEFTLKHVYRDKYR